MGAEGDARSIIHLQPNEGRRYRVGKMTAVFKADHDETASRYCVSEWWLEPHSAGPGAHSHEANDEVFYVIEGTASILAGETWTDAGAGSFVRIPATVMHDFENRTNGRVGLLNFFIPGGFEQNMPAIVKWFEENPAT